MPSAPTEKIGRSIVVFGTKGGVGKTVVATNVAVGLQQSGASVCLVDLDQTALGDVAKTLNLATPRSIADLMPVLKRNVAPEVIPFKDVVVPHGTGIHLLSLVAHLKQFAQIDLGLLPQVFHALKLRYDYVVIDAGKVFSDQLIAACDEANLILLVVTPDIVALYQTKWALGTLESLLFPADMVKLVLNRAESRGGVGSEEVKVALPRDVIAEIPSDGRTVGLSTNQGIPLISAYASTKIAESYRRLIEVLTTRPQLYITVNRTTHGDALGRPAAGAAAGQELRAEAADGLDEVIALKRRIHAALVEEFDLKKFDVSTMASQGQLDDIRQKAERLISNILGREMKDMLPSREVRARLVKEIADEALGLGPLEELMADPEITDILVNNKDEIYVERRGKLQLTAKKFISNDQVRTVIERIVAPLGRRIDEAAPMVDARLPDGSRVNAIIPPLSTKGPVLSIRKFSRERYLVEDLVRLGTLNSAMAQFIRACVLVRKNIIISGGTGSGKTTMLNILSSFIPDNERIITIEDAIELKLAQRHWISLEARPANVEGRGQIGIRDLFRNVLRMRPDRVIIGECRGAETLDMLQAMNTGHDGSLTTIHANSPKDVVSRLDSMVLMSNIDLPIRAIREMVASAIHVIIHTARLSSGARKVTSISEVVGLVNGTDMVLRELFIFKQTGMGAGGAIEGHFTATGQLPSFLAELRVKGIPLDDTLFAPEADSAAP